MATATTTWILQDRSNTTCGDVNGGKSQYTITNQSAANVRYFQTPNNNTYLYASKINSISVQIVHTHSNNRTFNITPRIYFNKLDDNNNRGYATFDAQSWTFSGSILKKVYTRNLDDTAGINLAPYVRSGVYELYRSWTRANSSGDALYWRSDSSTSNYVYFSATYEYTNPIHYYHNNAWENCCAYYYDGTNWVLCNPYYYNGSGFQNLG